jgi:hypothetical protein
MQASPEVVEQKRNEVEQLIETLLQTVQRLTELGAIEWKPDSDEEPLISHLAVNLRIETLEEYPYQPSVLDQFRQIYGVNLFHGRVFPSGPDDPCRDPYYTLVSEAAKNLSNTLRRKYGTKEQNELADRQTADAQAK